MTRHAAQPPAAPDGAREVREALGGFARAPRVGCEFAGEGRAHPSDPNAAGVSATGYSFGANEATIFSKRGSPRSGSQNGNSFKAP